MKKLCFLIAVTLTCFSLLTGCNKWLDVKAKTEVVETDMLSNEQGFMEALAGVYYTMAGNALYGEKLSMDLLDALALTYDIPNGYYPTNINNIDYNSLDQPGAMMDSKVRPVIDNIWDSMYYAIANANNIIAKADAKQAVFSGDNYRLVKGEAIGLRAFMHFDLLRMFGRSYMVGKDSLSIPYLTRFTGKVITPLFTVKAITDSIIRDLNTAAELLKDDDFNGSSVNNAWLNNRKCHFNKLAAAATLARVYLYRGDKTNAALYADTVINSNMLRFITSNEINRSQNTIDFSLSPEQVFSLKKYNLKDIYTKHFTSQQHDLTTQPDDGNGGNTGFLANIYETNSGGSTDIRRLYLWGYYSNVIFPQKYWTGSASKEQDLVPLIRLPEMYYIKAESKGPTEGVAVLNTVRKNRGLVALTGSFTNETFQHEIFKEYYKEYYAEGQIFYFYKRLNYSYFIKPNQFDRYDNPEYVFPIPEAEKQFLGR